MSALYCLTLKPLSRKVHEEDTQLSQYLSKNLKPIKLQHSRGENSS